MALTYKAGAIIEGCFRCMQQTGLQVRPMFHRAPRRIEVHVKPDLNTASQKILLFQ